MARILCLESSSDYCSVSVFDEEELIWNQEETKERSHAQKLGTMVKDSLRAFEGGSPEAIAVSAGPGSYTGLRIGVALAKGLCSGFDLPLISVPTLRIMLEAFKLSGDFQEADFFVPMIDARRMDVYYSIFDGKMKGLTEDQDMVLDANSFSKEREKGKCLFFGNGSRKFLELIGGVPKEENFGGDAKPLSKYMGKEAWRSFSNNEFQDLAYFEPKYVKDVFVTKPKPTFG